MQQGFRFLLQKRVSVLFVPDPVPAGVVCWVNIFASYFSCMYLKSTLYLRVCHGILFQSGRE